MTRDLSHSINIVTLPGPRVTVSSHVTNLNAASPATIDVKLLAITHIVQRVQVSS